MLTPVNEVSDPQGMNQSVIPIHVKNYITMPEKKMTDCNWEIGTVVYILTKCWFFCQ